MLKKRPKRAIIYVRRKLTYKYLPREDHNARIIMEKWKKTTTQLLSKLIIGTAENPSVAPYYPSKTVALSRDDKSFFKRVRPGRHGVSSARLYSMLSELEGNRDINIHNLLVLKNGEVILEASHPGYSTDMPHLAHSMSKTVTGIAIGILVDAGRLSLEDKMVDYFPEHEYKDKRFADITVEHLLRMASGIPFAEIATVTSEDWITDVFDTTLKFDPGAKFDYNSINSYILSVILTKVTGEGLSEFLSARLFQPLGIKNYFWEKSSCGYEKGGWGLFLSAESFAKIGLMISSGGTFFGRRILSRYWIDEMTSKKSEKVGNSAEFDYGYHIWVGRENDELLFNGMFGQNVWISPKNQTIVVINSGNSELFQRSGTIGIIRKYLGYEYNDTMHRDRFLFALRDKALRFFESRHWIRSRGHRGVLQRLGLIRERTDNLWYGIVGEYRFAKNNVGMLPFFLSLMQNNLHRSLEKMTVTVGSGSVTLAFTEAGEDYLIEFGLGRFISTVIDFRGEKYLVSAIAEVIEDEDRNPVYKFEIIFPEMPNTRKIKITRTDGGIFIRFSEMPDSRLVTQYTDSFTGSAIVMVALAAMKKRMGEGFIESLSARLFEPSLVGIKSEEERFEELMKSEIARLKKETERYSQLIGIVNHFVKDSDDGERAERRGPVALLGDFLRRRRDALIKSVEPSAALENINENAGLLSEPDGSAGVDIGLLESPSEALLTVMLDTEKILQDPAVIEQEGVPSPQEMTEDSTITPPDKEEI